MSSVSYLCFVAGIVFNSNFEVEEFWMKIAKRQKVRKTKELEDFLEKLSMNAKDKIEEEGVRKRKRTRDLSPYHMAGRWNRLKRVGPFVYILERSSKNIATAELKTKAWKKIQPCCWLFCLWLLCERFANGGYVVPDCSSSFGNFPFCTTIF